MLSLKHVHAWTEMSKTQYARLHLLNRWKHKTQHNQSYRNNSSTSRVHNSYLFVFARRRKEAAVKIPRQWEDGVRVNSNDVQTIASRRVP